MIQLIDQPYPTSFTRNPLIYRLRGVDDNGALFAALGVRSEVRVSAFHGPEVGETMILNWTEPDGTTGSVTFTASATPTAVNEIPAVVGNSPGGYPDWTSYYNAVGDAMKAHPTLGPLFKFYTVNRGTGQSFWAEALELDDNWAVTWDVSGIATPPTFEIVDTTTVTPNPIPDNYRIVWDLMLESSYLSGNYEKAASGEAFLNADSEAVINLEKVLDAKVSTTLATPSIPTYANSEVLLADNLRRYYIRYREDYDNQATPAWTISDDRQVVYGGISQNLYTAGNFFSARNADSSLLTWRPDNRRVSVGQKEYLAWYNYTGTTKDVQLEYIGTRADGTTTSATIHAAQNAQALAGQTLLFPAGFEQMGQFDIDIVSYTARVVDKNPLPDARDAYLSSEQRYQIDRYYRESERFIMYLNGFGCPETVRFIGYFSKDMEVSREQSESILRTDYSNTTRQLQQHNRSWQNTFTYRTGFLPALEVDSLQELLIASEVYEIFPAVYIPLYVESKGMAITETRQLLHSVVLAAVPALLEKNYSTLITETGESGFWLTTDGSYWLTLAGDRWETI